MADDAGIFHEQGMRILILFLLLGAGCFAGRFGDGEPLREDLLAKIEPGKSTAKDVTEILGPPQEIVELDRRSAYHYRYTKRASAGLLIILVGVFNEDTRSDRIWLFFDESDVLTHYGATFESHRAHFALPWKDIHDPEKSAKRDKKRKKKESQQPR